MIDRRGFLALGAASLLGITPALAQERLKVVTTFTVIADMARNVAGDAAEVVSITKPGAEIHGYEPTPQDIVGAHDADLILWNTDPLSPMAKRVKVFRMGVEVKKVQDQ